MSSGVLRLGSDAFVRLRAGDHFNSGAGGIFSCPNRVRGDRNCPMWMVYGAGLYMLHWKALSVLCPLVLAATAAAFLGAYLDKKLIHKVTLRGVQILVGVMLVLC